MYAFIYMNYQAMAKINYYSQIEYRRKRKDLDSK